MQEAYLLSSPCTQECRTTQPVPCRPNAAATHC